MFQESLFFWLYCKINRKKSDICWRLAQIKIAVNSQWKKKTRGVRNSWRFSEERSPLGKYFGPKLLTLSRCRVTSGLWHLDIRQLSVLVHLKWDCFHWFIALLWRVQLACEGLSTHFQQSTMASARMTQVRGFFSTVPVGHELGSPTSAAQAYTTTPVYSSRLNWDELGLM